MGQGTAGSRNGGPVAFLIQEAGDGFEDLVGVGLHVS